MDRGVSIYFVDCPELYSRRSLYGEGGEDYPDNDVRFGVFSHAVLEIIRSLFRPDVVHCHDWQAALVPVLMREKFRLDPTFSGIKVLLTIHNLGYQGLFPPVAIERLGLSPDLLTPAGLGFFGQVNFLQGGIVYSDGLNTVSKAYAREIQTKEYGFGLDGLLRARADVLTGIINGVDYEEWSPEHDRYIGCRYSVSDTSPKRVCKQELLRAFGLPSDRLDRPVIGIVSRFAAQKGFDLIEQIADSLVAEDIFMTILGSGEPRFEELFRSLAESCPEKVGVRVTYSNELAHKVEAGADMFLMPSRYEPCGLNQIYSLKYGTVPIVRATGGLDDTINDRNGFKFHEYTGEALLAEIRTASTLTGNKADWQALMRNGMQADFSWDASAAEYSDLYRRIAG